MCVCVCVCVCVVHSGLPQLSQIHFTQFGLPYELTEQNTKLYTHCVNGSSTCMSVSTLFCAMHETGLACRSGTVRTHWPTFMSSTSSDLSEPARMTMSEPC